MAPPRAPLLAGAALLALGCLVARTDAYVCLNGDPCRAEPCYASQICTTVPSSRGGGLCVAVCSNPQPQPQPQPPYNSNGGACVACTTNNPCSVATCPATSYCIGDPCRCTWTCAAQAPPKPPTPQPPTPQPPTPPRPSPTPPTPAPLPNGGCPATLPYVACYSDPCAQVGIAACPRNTYCQASNCGACRALCVRPAVAETGAGVAAAAADKAAASAAAPPLEATEAEPVAKVVAAANKLVVAAAATKP